MNRSTPKHRNNLLGLLVEQAFLIVGMAVLAYGLAMTVSTPWGVSAWDVFHLGVVRHTGLSLGRVGQLTGLVLLVAAWLIRRRYVTGVSLANALLVGWFIDLFREHGLVAYVDGLAGLLYLEAGVVVFALGMALYLAPERGAGPRDALMMSIADRLGTGVARVRTVMEVAAVAAGALLGGPVGVGTVLAALTLGPWVARFLEPVRRLYRRALGSAGGAPQSLPRSDPPAPL